MGSLSFMLLDKKDAAKPHQKIFKEETK